MGNDCLAHSVPSLCALLSLVLNSIQFLQRHLCSSHKKQKSLTISWIWLGNVIIYIVLLSGLSWIIYREKLCRIVVIFILFLSLNWILNLFSLYLNQISKNQIAIAFQVLASLLELITVTWLVVVSLTSEKINNFPFYYWIILIGSVIWGYLCNLLWLNSLYTLRQSQSQYQSLLSDDEVNSRNELEETISLEESKIIQSMFYLWFTPVLNVGGGNAIEWTDLTELPESMSSKVTRSYIQPFPDDSSVNENLPPCSSTIFNFIFSLVTCRCWNKSSKEDLEDGNDDEEDGGNPNQTDPLLPPLYHAAPLIRAILVEGSRGSTFLLLGSLKLCTIGLSFVGPLLLGRMVKLIENDPNPKDIPLGILLACALGFSFILSAVLNTQYSIRANVLQIKVRSALALGLFSRALRLPLYKHVSLGLSDAKLSNMQQVDVGRAGDIITTIHDLWSLPLQILIAFILLYLQVNVGFLAGVIIILVMIPLNRFIAVKIGTATKELMIHKDARVKLITECFRNIKSIKMSGLEETMSAKSMIHREQEIKFLSQRKYLDSWCVFLWASLPLLVPYITFVTTVVALNRQLTASEVFTTLALLNMLIFPMNAYPWIINGAVEASVSIRRLSSILVVPAYSPDHDDDQETKVDLGVVNPFRDDQHYASDPGTGTGIGIGASMEEPFMTKHFKSSSSTSSQSLIEAVDLMISWNEEALNQTSPTIRTSSRDSSSSSERLFDQKLVLEDSNFVVGPITLTNVTSEQVIGICGGVGSGKTTFLMGLLNECYTTIANANSNANANANAKVLKGTVSYCSQSPRLHAGTIFHDRCLDEDFRLFENSLGDEIGSSYGMDEEDIGQGGSRLSGGQRLRVGIARALYSSSTIVLLDDPFSALDRNTSHRLMTFISSLAQRERRLVLLVTNEVHMFQTGVSSIMFLSGGKVAGMGTFQELHDSLESFRNMIEKRVENVVWDESMQLETEKDNETHLLSDDEDNFPKSGGGLTVNAQSELAKGEESEHMGRGEIENHVVGAYFRAAGIGVVLLVLSSTFMMQSSANGMSFWLAYWSDRVENISDNKFVLISSLIVGVNVVFAFIRSFSFAWGGLIAARREYQKLTDSTLSTFLYFFENTNLGRIINRFGKDSDIIDDQLPFMLNRVLAQVFTLVGALIVISISSVLVIGVVCIVAIIYYRLQIFYRKSSRDIRRLDAIYRSPVGNLLLDCLSNAPTIRAQKLQENFELKMAHAIDASQRVTLTGNIAAQWLSIRLQLLGVLITFSLAFVSVFNAIYRVAPVSASMLGLSLSYAFSLVANLNNLVNSVIETEQEMISVERVEEYVHLPSEFGPLDLSNPAVISKNSLENLTSLQISNRSLSTESSLGDTHLSSLDWPLDGSIILNNVSFSYHMERRYFEKENNLPNTTTAALGQVYNGGWQHSNTQFETLPRRRESLFGTAESDLEEISLPYALRNISIVIPTGSRVAVVGRTGSGKSSFLRTILNLNKHYRGQISVGGVNIKEISKKVLRSNCGVISQDPFLFSGTIRDNLDPRGLYSDNDLVQVMPLPSLLLPSSPSYLPSLVLSTRSHCQQALCKCGIMDTFSESSDIGILMRDVASEFEQRHDLQNDASPSSSTQQRSVSIAAEMLLNCVIVDAASTLSQGQKQLLCVARILLGNPRFVFLDEASSSLDPTSELLMYTSLKKHLPLETTVLAVSHRYDREGIRSLCSQVLELENGRITKYEDIFFL